MAPLSNRGEQKKIIIIIKQSQQNEAQASTKTNEPMAECDGDDAAKQASSHRHSWCWTRRNKTAGAEARRGWGGDVKKGNQARLQPATDLFKLHTSDEQLVPALCLFLLIHTRVHNGVCVCSQHDAQLLPQRSGVAAAGREG